MRKKLTEEEKKISFGVSISPDLLNILKNYTTENNIKISRFIEELLRKKLENK